MSSGMVSRWPVLVSAPVVAADRDGDGRVTDAALDRLFAEARAEYFDECATVDVSALDVSSTTAHRGTAPAGDGVTISVNVVEVFPDRFTMTARLRPSASDGIVATAWCTVSPRGGVPDEMRDEFIALAHAAGHVH